MSDNKNCKDCRFSQGHSAGKSSGMLCKRFPPQIIKLNTHTHKTAYPVVSLKDWCWEFKK